MLVKASVGQLWPAWFKSGQPMQANANVRLWIAWAKFIVLRNRPCMAKVPWMPFKKKQGVEFSDLVFHRVNITKILELSALEQI